MLGSPRLKAFPALIIAIFFCGLLYTTFTYDEPTGRPPLRFDSGNSSEYFEPTLHNIRFQQIDFWQQFSQLLKVNKPKIAKLNRTNGKNSTKVVHFSAIKEFKRPDLVIITDAEIEGMRKSHESFTASITQSMPKLAYQPSTRGIVTTAGGKYLPVAVISLRMLRRTNNDLPVEVIISKREEYEPFVCEEVFPQLNAKCIVLEDIFKASGSSADLKKYQLKIFAILFSSFEEVLFLDADAWPVEDPQRLFESDPYRSNGLVLWPDFWGSTTSSHFFTIASVPVQQISLRATSETGEIVISKKSHALSLLIATYYNFYGPGLYYTLLSQGAIGEGDKETFLAGALAANQSFYTVRKSVEAIGHLNKEGGVAGSAMIQHDPTADYYNTIGLAPSGNHSVASIDGTKPRPFFVHCNFPKFNPARIYDSKVVNKNGTYTRAWTASLTTMDRFGFDVEEAYWREIVWAACNLEREISDWKKEKDICKRAKTHYGDVFGRSAPA